MIVIILVLVFIFATGIIFFIRENEKFKIDLLEINDINNKLDILKDLSHLLLIKNTPFKEALDKFFLSFSKQDKYKAFSLTLNAETFRYPELTGEQSSQEQILLSTYEAPLYFQNQRLGSVVFLSLNNNLAENEKIFLDSIANILTLLIKKIELGNNISREERIKAINIKW